MTTSSPSSRSSSSRCPTIPGGTPDHVIELASWPLGTAVGRDGHVRIGTHDLQTLADRYGTPLYVYDAATIRASLREYVDAFFRHRPVRVAYSVKACALIGVGSVIAHEGIDASVASLGELQAARRAGFPVSRMELHGNAKPDDEVTEALAARVGRFVIDGAHDIERLARLTHGRRRPQAVWLRVAPGIQVETHIRTWLQERSIASSARRSAQVKRSRRRGRSRERRASCSSASTRISAPRYETRAHTVSSRVLSLLSRTRSVPRPVLRSRSSAWAAASRCASARRRRRLSWTTTR